MTKINITPFDWKMIPMQEHYSHWYKELVKTKTSKLTEKEFREYAIGLGVDKSKVNDYVRYINDKRRELKTTLKKTFGDGISTILDEGMTLEQFVKNAFPYERILMIRY